MDLDDQPIKKKQNMVIGENLDAVSIAELEQRIVDLDSEILRVRAEIARKRSSLLSAASFFKN